MAELSEEQKEARRVNLARARGIAVEKRQEEARQKALARAEAKRAAPQPVDLVAEMLSEEEITEIRVQAKAKVMAEMKAEAKKRILDKAVDEERLIAGLIPVATQQQRWLDELVEVHVSLPRQGPRDNPTLMIDQRIFHHGRTVTVSRAQAMTMKEMMQRQWWHQAQIKGESRNYYDELLGGMVYQGGVARGSGSMA